MAEQEETIWIENLDRHLVKFKGATGAFTLEGRGFHGSVQQVDAIILKDPYIRRVLTKKSVLGTLSAEDAMAKIDTLVDKEDVENGVDHLLESLSEGASERVSRYKKNLPEEAEQSSRSLSAEEIWKGQTSKSQSEKTVTRSNAPSSTDIKSVTVTDKVREGEWETQTN